MSRMQQQPFPSSSRPRGNMPPPGAYDGRFDNSTVPLAINRERPIARTMTPSSSTGSVTSARASPARPARSERRPRHASQLSVSSIASRDMMFEKESDSRGGPSASAMNEEDPASPVALKAVLTAFQQAGSQRKRAMTNGTMERERERDREIEEERQRQLRIQKRIPGRGANGKMKAIGTIDAVLDRVEDDWAFVVDQDFNPVDLALQLLDSDASGKDPESFRQTKVMLSKALKGSVDKHYQSFAAALPHHASVLGHLTATQTQASEARIALQEAKDALGTKRSDLVQLSTRGQTVDEMLRLLDEIEYLKSVPDTLESLMSEKRLLHAAGLLVRSLKMIKKPEMTDIGAVSDLRSYLISQENSLRDILIDELHSHLFLKTFWCDSRWAAYTPNRTSLPDVEYDKEVTSFSSSEESPLLSGACPPRLKKFLTELATKPNDPPLDINEPRHKRSLSASRTFSIGSISTLIDRDQPYNPESDSFRYMEILLESLAILGKLGIALDIISQRLPTEIYQLVERTIDEAHERAEMSQRVTFYGKTIAGRPSSVYVFTNATDSLGDNLSSVAASALRLAALESLEKQADHEVLRDLFWTLYSKLDAVTQGLRVAHEVANRIGSRHDFKDSSGAKLGTVFPLAEMWLPIQGEIRTLLNDYLSDEGQGRAANRNPISSINEILRESKFNRDRAKHVFRFVDTDNRNAKRSLRSHENELNHVLRETVPGLVQGGLETAVQTMLSHVGTDDRVLGAEHHRLLIQSDAFHVSILFQPTLTFLNRIADILPAGLESTRASTELLDDFVLNIYLPQLEEKSSMLFHDIVAGHDSFLIDPASLKLSAEPLLKHNINQVSTQLMALINSLCAMLRTTPFHRDNYSRLVLSVIIQFYQRCSDRFQDVLSRNSQDLTDTRLLISARWAQRDDLGSCLSSLHRTTSLIDRAQACELENRLELPLVESSEIEKEDLLSSIHDLSFLCNFHRSITWLVEQLLALRMTPDADPRTPGSTTSLSLPLMLPPGEDSQLQLPLSRDMEDRYSALISTYEQLAQMVLFTVRLDIRCRVIHYLATAMRHGNYRIDQEDSEPDPHVIDLNNELGKADEVVSIALPERERVFVFDGLELLMEDILITSARHIRVANIHGTRKILRNIIALRQNVKTLTCLASSSDFERSREFWGLFSLGPQAMLDSIKRERRYHFEDYQAMLNLQCGVDQLQGQAGVAQASDKRFNEYAIELHGLELEYPVDNGP